MKKNIHVGFLCTCAILAAFSIIFGKYLAINVGENFRFSLENLPILLSALYFGPLAGAIVGAVADLVGCLLVGYAINPVITFGAISIGLVCGWVGKHFKKHNFLRIAVSVSSAHLIGSVLIKTVGLYLYYGSPLLATAVWRLAVYACTGLAELIILFLLSKNQAFEKQMNRIKL